MPNNISLSSIDTDFEQVKQKLVTYLQSTDSWKNALPSSTGNALVNISAFVGSSALLSIENALQEAFPDTARSEASILNIARYIWGLHIKRKVCAQITSNLTNNTGSTITIPKYSQFTINGTNCFNRAIINIPASTTITTTLYQGTVNSETLTSSGIINERFYLGSSADPFAISDDDLYCIANTTEEYTKTTEGLYTTGPIAANQFYENSLPTGEVEILFGDGSYGKLPVTNSSLQFIYVTTLGASGNNLISVGDTITYAANPSLAGVTTSASNAGADQLSAEFYKIHGPALRSVKVRGGGVTRPQHKAIALTYPGVIDCNLLGQAETYPNNKAYMNVITAVVLTNPLMNNTQFTAFANYMKDRVVDNLDFIQLNPVAVNRTISCDIYCTSKADPNSVKLAVQTALQSLQTLKLGSLGRSFYLSDIDKVIRDAIGDPTLLDYFILSSPTTDTIVNKNEYVNFTSITVNGYYTVRDIIIT